MPPAPQSHLELGKLAIMASGTLNGQPLETRWMPPFAWEAGHLLKEKDNDLRITVSPLNQDEPALLEGPVKLHWQTHSLE